MKSAFQNLSRLLAASALCLFVTAPAHAGEQDFTLHNATGVEIHEVFVSPTKSDDWEEDILGEENTLPDGESVEITFDDRDTTKKWDIKVTDGDEGNITWTGLDLTKISELTLHFKKGKAWADVE